jgi:hypothetical protein
MSRFDDSYDEDFPNQWALYEKAQQNALRGKRGQAVLKELEAALLAMPVKRLIHGFLAHEGEVCALGALAAKRKVDGGLAWKDAVDELPSCDGSVSDTIDFAESRLKIKQTLAIAISYQNDEGVEWRATPEERWEKVLQWVREQIKS